VHYEAHHNGAMNFLEQNNEINYFPSTIDRLHESQPYPHDPDPLAGVQMRQNIVLTDNFNQAGDRWRSFDVDRQDRFAKRVAATLATERVTDGLKTIWYGYWNQVDPVLGKKIQQGVEDILVHKKQGMLEFKKAVLAASTGSHHL